MNKTLKITITLSIILLLISISYLSKKIEYISIEYINNKPSILFKKTCNYNAFYIEDDSESEIGNIQYSPIPGEGASFTHGTYIPIEKLLQVKIKNNSKYRLSAITECADYPTYRKYIDFSFTGVEIQIIEQ